MFSNPFTSFDDLDIMNLAQQAQSRAEAEADNLSFTTGDYTMATPTPAKKVLKKKATPDAAPKAETKAKPAAEPKAKAPAKTEAKRGAKAGPRTAPEGFVGLNDLATEFSTTAAVIRRKLRGSDLTKPEGHSWQFKDGSKDLAAVRKLLTPAK